ncbi:hypothetical protein M885DRAFT_611793 [Pelagophyceae sp. CCMP2097]|nr:hypothetical protein M885DRAFT_611793 [Pelagophyceae sp. CCMP2097]
MRRAAQLEDAYLQDIRSVASFPHLRMLYTRDFSAAAALTNHGLPRGSRASTGPRTAPASRSAPPSPLSPASRPSTGWPDVGASRLEASSAGASAGARRLRPETPFSSTSPLLQSSLGNLAPMRDCIEKLAVGRQQRRRVRAAATQPWIAHLQAQAAADGAPGAQPTPEARAMAKVRLAALHYERTFASSRESFAAFEAPDLRAGAFRAQLLRAGVSLAPAEAAALAARFGRPGRRGSIDGAAFVRFFFGVGAEARADRRESDRGHDPTVGRAFDRARRHRANEDADAAPDWTADDARSAWAALAEASANKGQGGYTISRRAFEARLAPAELREQLLHSYGVRLSARETAALCATVGVDGDGRIYGAEFQRQLSRHLDGHRLRAHEATESRALLRPHVVDGGGETDGAAADDGAAATKDAAAAAGGAAPERRRRPWQAPKRAPRPSTAGQMRQSRAPPGLFSTSSPADAHAGTAWQRPSSLDLSLEVARRGMLKPTSLTPQARRRPSSASAAPPMVLRPSSASAAPPIVLR